MPVRNGNPGNDQTTTTTVASVRKQLGKKIARVTRADLQEKHGGVKGRDRNAERRLARSRLLWAGYVERMADGRLPKRAAELREHGRRRRGRPRLRWEDCVKRDVRKAGGEEDCKRHETEEGGKDYQMRQ